MRWREILKESDSWESIWLNADTLEVVLSSYDHMEAILDDPARFGVDRIDLDDPSQPFRDAFRNAWVRIRAKPEWHTAVVQADTRLWARKAVAWVVDNRPDLFSLGEFRLEISRDRIDAILNHDEAVKFAKRGILPR